LEEKGGCLQAEEHHPNYEVQRGSIIMLWGCVAAGGTYRWHHEVGKLCGYIEATSKDISQEVKAWLQMGANGSSKCIYFTNKFLFSMTA
jgi:hypothetical protein